MKMFKDYVVVDDVLSNPEELIVQAKKIPYFSNEKKPITGINLDVSGYENVRPIGKWQGFRSAPLEFVNSSLHSLLLNEITSKVFNPFKVKDLNADSYCHYSCESIIYNDNWWHVDSTDGNITYAGVVYLTPSEEYIPGTILRVNNNDVIIKYKFNRLVFYRSDILHRPGKLFGNDVNNSRLTFTFFITKINLIR
jgi:hypothetical protein